MAKFYLCLGGNIGNTRKIFEEAIDKIESQIGKIINSSVLFKSEPWGFESVQLFLNQVIVVDSNIPADRVLEKCLEIELNMGRVRGNSGYISRNIDIDILFVDSEIINTNKLTVPHPLLHKRNFVLKPLCSIAPNFVHPVLKKDIATLLSECDDTLGCEPLV